MQINATESLQAVYGPDWEAVTGQRSAEVLGKLSAVISDHVRDESRAEHAATIGAVTILLTHVINALTPDVAREKLKHAVVAMIMHETKHATHGTMPDAVGHG